MSNIIFETSRIIGINAHPSFNRSLMDLFNDKANSFVFGGTTYNQSEIGNMLQSMASEAEENPRIGFRLMLVNKEDDKLIGFGSTKKFTEDFYPEIGFVIASARTGQGYGSEAAKGLTDLSFRHFGAKTVIAEVEPANIASIKVLEKNHYRFSERRSGVFYNGRTLEDTLIYQVNKSPDLSITGA